MGEFFIYQKGVKKFLKSHIFLNNQVKYGCKTKKPNTLIIMLISDKKHNKIYIEFSAGEISTDSGGILGKEFFDQIGLQKTLDELFDKGEEIKKDLDRKGGPEREYYTSDIIYQILLGFILGYKNPTEFERLIKDPVITYLLEKKKIASQATFSRTITDFSITDEQALQKLQTDLLSAYFDDLIRNNNGKKLDEIKIDMDSTGITTYGHQEDANFNGHYNTTGYHPNLITAEDLNLVLYGLLRPGSTFSSKGAEEELAFILHFLSKYYEKIVFKADSAYATPAILKVLHTHIDLDISKIEYFIKTKKYTSWLDNSAPFQKFKHKTYSVMNLPQAYFEEEANEKTILKDRYFSFNHKCNTWEHQEKIIARVRCSKNDQQSLFDSTNKEISLVITNAPAVDNTIFNDYGNRAKCEKSIEELKNDNFAKNLSSHSFISNSCLFLLKCIAHNLIQLIRLYALQDTAYKQARTSTIRRILFKIGGKIVKTARYVFLKLSSCFVYKDVFIKAFRHIQTIQLRL